jgi:hypothetical protein
MDIFVVIKLKFLYSNAPIGRNIYNDNNIPTSLEKQ